MVWPTVLAISLVYSLVVFGGMTLMILCGGLVANDAMLHDYPRAIQERHGPKTPRGVLVTRLMNVVGVVLLTAASIAVIGYVRGELGGDIGFLPAFVVGTVTVIVVNVLDLVILDWWVFCTIQPRFLVPESTRGMPEYRDYSFHWKVLMPSPVPWPLLLIPAYGVILGVGTIAFEAVR